MDMERKKTTNCHAILKNGILVFILVAIVATVYVLKQGKTESDYEVIPLATHMNGQHYVGSESCAACHADIYRSHLETAHHSSSAQADARSVKGSLKEGSNTYSLNDSVLVEMTSSADGIFQEVLWGRNRAPIGGSSMDVVIGSGTKGQSYLTWNGDALYQLPISYLTPSDRWTISPGMDFKRNSSLRPVNAICMECHTTFTKNTALYGMGNTYDRSKMLYGIDCERCHGPSGEHVAFHKNNPSSSTAQYIIDYDGLSRERRLDACALCHSGMRSNNKPAFLFLAGDTLNNYSVSNTVPPVEEIDVHGNQYALLKASKCFEQTATMNCTTCHNPHKNQRGNTGYFNSKCITCHQKKELVCTEDATVKSELGNNCISCHMPLQPSSSMFVRAEEGDSIKTAVEVRTHLIAVYLKGDNLIKK